MMTMVVVVIMLKTPIKSQKRRGLIYCRDTGLLLLLLFIIIIIIILLHL